MSASHPPGEPATAAAERLLGALRREVARAARAGREDAGAPIDRLIAALEADPGARADLEAVVGAADRLDPLGAAAAGPRSARAARQARAEAARQLLGALARSGAVVDDGPDRVALPGFGPCSWRALAALRRGHADPWSVALAAAAAPALGAARPPFLERISPDPRLREEVAAVRRLEARRHALRDALIAHEERIGVALEAGNDPGADSLRRDAADLVAAIARLDAELARAWRRGRSAALRYAAAP